MFQAFVIAVPERLPKGAHGRQSTRWNNDSDALAALTVLAAGRNIDAESRRRAMAQLAGLPCWLTAMIITRHAQTKSLCPVDIEIANILWDLENEGILGPAS